MAIAKGAKSRLAWKEETTFGTQATGNYNFRPISNETLDTAIETITGEDIREDRATPNLRGGNIATGGNITHDFGIVQSLPWLRHLVAAGEDAAGVALTIPALAAASKVDYKRGEYVTGTGGAVYVCVYGGTIDAGVLDTDLTVTSGRQNILDSAATTPLVFEYCGPSGATYYTHTITAGGSFPAGGISLEKQILGGDSSLYIDFFGGRIGSLDLNLIQRGILKASWEWLGIGNTAGSTTGAGVPTTSAETPAVGHDVYIHVADGYVGANANQVWREGTFRVNNNIETDAYVMGNRFRIDVPEGQRQVSGNLTAYFTDTSLYDKFIAETTFAMGFSIIRDGDFMLFEFPEVKLTGNGAPKISAAGLLTMTFDWTAFKNTAAYDLKITAVNTVQNLPK